MILYFKKIKKDQSQRHPISIQKSFMKSFLNHLITV